VTASLNPTACGRVAAKEHFLAALAFQVGKQTTTRPLRADAARNRELRLTAAAEEFAERGLDASVADIARRAGVGKGTVFRRFATKDDLLAAIAIDRIETLVAAGRRLLDAADPGAALLEFLTVAARRTTTTRPVVPAATPNRQIGPPHPPAARVPDVGHK
jgi:AcrR family transcriptional regulator